MDPEEDDRTYGALKRYLHHANAWKKMNQSFAERLKEELIQLSIVYFPELETCSDKWVEPLHTELKIWGDCILEGYRRIVKMDEKKVLSQFIYPIPKPKTTVEIEKELRSLLAEFPNKIHPVLIEYYHNGLAEERFYSEFIVKVHNKIKEILYLFFPEIIDLTGNQLRLLNEDLYLYGVMEYVETFYKLTDNYITDRFKL